jgi:hypothetical protein
LTENDWRTALDGGFIIENVYKTFAYVAFSPLNDIKIHKYLTNLSYDHNYWVYLALTSDLWSLIETKMIIVIDYTLK